MSTHIRISRWKMVDFAWLGGYHRPILCCQFSLWNEDRRALEAVFPSAGDFLLGRSVRLLHLFELWRLLPERMGCRYGSGGIPFTP